MVRPEDENIHTGRKQKKETEEGNILHTGRGNSHTGRGKHSDCAL